MYNRYIIFIISVVLLFMTGTAVYVYRIDPYGLYRPVIRSKELTRQQASSIIRYADYNALITGTSMLINADPAVADSLWGWKTENVSLLGNSYSNCAILYPFIAKIGKARNIIVSIDYITFSTSSLNIPKYLYDNNKLNDYLYLFSGSAVEDAYSYARDVDKKKKQIRFMEMYMTGDRPNIKPNYKAINDCGRANSFRYRFENLRNNFDDAMLPSLISDVGKKIHWYLTFPPYCITYFLTCDNAGSLDEVFKFKQYIYKQVAHLPNVTLYDFQCQPWITDLDEHVDFMHHSQAMTHRELEAMHAGQYLATPDGHAPQIRALVRQYRDSL